VGVSIQRGEPLKTAYHVRMLILEKISRHFCATTIVLAGISKNNKIFCLGGGKFRVGRGRESNTFLIWPKASQMLKHFKQRGELFQTNYPTGTFSVTN
jgi:hypothetical protein